MATRGESRSGSDQAGVDCRCSLHDRGACGRICPALLHDKPEQLAQPRLQGRCVELLPCSCRGDDQHAKHVQGAGFVRLAVEHRPHQEGKVAVETRVGVQAGG